MQDWLMTGEKKCTVILMTTESELTQIIFWDWHVYACYNSAIALSNHATVERQTDLNTAWKKSGRMKSVLEQDEVFSTSLADGFKLLMKADCLGSTHAVSERT